MAHAGALERATVVYALPPCAAPTGQRSSLSDVTRAIERCLHNECYSMNRARPTGATSLEEGRWHVCAQQGSRHQDGERRRDPVHLTEERGGTDEDATQPTITSLVSQNCRPSHT